MQSWLRCFRAWISLKSYFNFGKIISNRHAVSRTTIRASRRAAQLVASSEQRKTLTGFGFNYSINSVWLFSHGCRSLRHGESARLVVIVMIIVFSTTRPYAMYYWEIWVRSGHMADSEVTRHAVFASVSRHQHFWHAAELLRKTGCTNFYRRKSCIGRQSFIRLVAQSTAIINTTCCVTLALALFIVCFFHDKS